MKFEIKNRDAAGRICKLKTNHGTVTTPNLMPVINPNKMIISPREMKKLFGAEIVITNSYIIKRDEKLRKIALKDGVNRLIDFDGPIMTDSGTFQSYVYGDVDVNYLDIVKFQNKIGSDIGTILDVFGTPDLSKEESKKGMQETIKRAKDSIKIKKDMNLACTIQGSIYPELRTKCAKELSKIKSDFFPIGGVVPLMENQRYSDLVKVIISSKMGLDPSKPVHLFGAGHPIIFPLAVALGCDFFDSSSYVKYAVDDRLIFPWGTEKLDNISELPCNCPVCSSYSALELKSLSKNIILKEISKHNLYVCFAELKKIRNAISQGSLWELVERRANTNPYLLEALKELKNINYKKWLERSEPISKTSALFYTGANTIHRPIIYRIQKKLSNIYTDDKRDIILFKESTKPYFLSYKNQIKEILSKNSNINIIIDSKLGPVPIELDEMYPFAQSIFPKETDIETEKYVSDFFIDFTKNNKIIEWHGKKTLDSIKKIKKNDFNFDINRIKAVCDMQFGKNSGDKLLTGLIKIVKSKKTNKIRNIYSDEKHILSMRASDGMFTLKIDGARLLHKNLKSPKLRVIIDNDAVPFIREGKSVFSKFVIDCDKELRPYDECLIVDKKDNLLACGRTLLNKEEMLSFSDGIAVKNREKLEK